MAWETISAVERGPKYANLVGITLNGITIGADWLEHFESGAAQVLIDEEKMLLGIKPANPKDKDAYNVKTTEKSTAGYITSRRVSTMLMHLMGETETVRFTPTWNGKGEILVVSLGEPVE